MRLRPLDRDDRDAYLREIRPRLLTLRLKAGRLDLRWLVPSWAVEEPIRFLLRATSLAIAVAPERARWLAAAAGSAARPAPGDATPSARWWRAADAFFSEADRDLLALPDGVPLVDVRAADARIVVAEMRP